MKKNYHGLTDRQVEESRAKHGTNILTPLAKAPVWKLYLEKFRDPLIAILTVIGVFAIGVSCYEYWVLHESIRVFTEPVGIFIAILLATGIAFYFELKAQKEFTLLNSENDHELVAVIRNGRTREIPKCDVVVGDILVLQTGQEVPADATLFEAVNMLVDESSLTGEPAHEKHVDEEAHEGATYPCNRVYRGTQVMEGHGLAEVTQVGDRTENGRIMQSLAGVDDVDRIEGNDNEDENNTRNTKARLSKMQRLAIRLRARNRVTKRIKTPLNEQLNRLSKVITLLSYAVAVAVVAGRILMYFTSLASSPTGYDGFEFTHFLAYVLQTIMIAVTLVVVAVPEGLPMAVSLALAGSMRRMLKTNNLVRKMHACETMGAATVICTDKTGTLTQNLMQVRECDVPDRSESKAWQSFCEGIAVNSTASIDFSVEKPHVIGNPTEGALLLWLHEQGVDYVALRNEAEVVAEIPFSTDRKFMATQVKTADGGSVVYVKGAPEVLLDMAAVFHEGHTREDYEQLLTGYQRRAMRTLAFAWQAGSAGEVMIENGRLVAPRLMFVGVVGIEDPVREDVRDAVTVCRNAGIDIKIVTGDTADTAREIGRQIGVYGRDNDSLAENDDEDDGSVMDGRTFAALSDDEVHRRVAGLKIISRARPLDKKRLVEALQARGEVVAVTGDGTNDAPALNAAHVGLSMGTGTSVAKMASDITIIDNSFASIVRAVMWGRSLYQNIQRFLLFQLTVNVAACLIVLMGAFMGTESPLTVTQMLWVNLIMDSFGAVALSSLPPSEKVMHDKPRDRRAFILNRSMIANITGVGGFFFLLLLVLLYIFQHADIRQMSDLLTLTLGEKNSVTPYEQTLLFSVFVWTHFWYMFNTRAYMTDGSGLNLKGCDGFITIALVIVVGQVLIVEAFSGFFNVVPMKLCDWVVIILISSLVTLVREAYAMVCRGIRD